MERIEQIDQHISFWINSLGGNGALDPFWIFMSKIQVWFPLYALIAALLIWKLGWKKGLVAVAAVALAFFFNERVNNLIKSLVERPRPCNDPIMLDAGIRVLKEALGFSFPSGHSCNCFGLAVSSTICLKECSDKRLNWYVAFIFLWAALVGISRIMLANHYLGDVLTGAVTGSIMGLIWALVARKVFKIIDSKSMA